MVAYSFKPSFEHPIRIKEKRQTIRLPRRRRTIAGDSLQFFTGPRMRPIKWGEATCLLVREVRLDFTGRGLVTLDDVVTIDDAAELDAFAIRDGFRPPVMHYDPDELKAALRADWAPAPGVTVQARRTEEICHRILQGFSILQVAKMACAPRDYVVKIAQAMPVFGGWTAKDDEAA